MKRLLQSLSARIYPKDIIIDNDRHFQYEVDQVSTNFISVIFSRKHKHATIVMPMMRAKKLRCVTFKREIEKIGERINNNETVKMFMTNGNKYGR